MARIALAQKKDDDILPSFQPEKYARLRARLHVDMMLITEGLVAQPELMQEIGEAGAVAQSMRDEAENNLKVIKAMASDDLRGVHKSEAAIEKALPAHGDVVDWTKKVEAAKLNAGLWTALFESAKARTSALKHISELVVSGYATPNAIQGERGPNPYYKKGE